LAKKQINLYIILIALCTFPSISYSEGASSLAKGLLIWSLILISINLRDVNDLIKKLMISKLFYIAYLLLVIHFLISFSNNIDLNISKFIYSFLFLPIILIASHVLLLKINELTNSEINIVVSSVGFSLLVILVASLFFKSSFFEMNQKSIIFFAEPSHFALIFSPFFLYLVLTLNKVWSRYLLLQVFIIITVIDNATLLIVFILGFIIHLINTFDNSRYLVFISFFCTLLMLNIDIDFSYYVDRFIYNSDNYNMSILVYLTGWERAWNILLNYSPIGIGFQQFGYEHLQGYFYEKLIYVGGGGLNIFDGATLGSKVLGEFGLLGLLLFVLYFNYFFKNIINILFNPCKFKGITLFFACIYFSFSVYLFVRGMGYFSELPFLFFTSLVYLINKDFKKNIV